MERIISYEFRVFIILEIIPIGDCLIRCMDYSSILLVHKSDIRNFHTFGINEIRQRFLIVVILLVWFKKYQLKEKKQDLGEKWYQEVLRQLQEVDTQNH
jgi:hypothetical protein